MAQMKSTKNYVYVVVVDKAWDEKYCVDFALKGVFTNHEAAVAAAKKVYAKLEKEDKEVFDIKVKNAVHKMYFDREYDESVGSYIE